jgi:hypothetical protein
MRNVSTGLRIVRNGWWAAALFGASAAAATTPLATTSDDFRAPGTQPLTVAHEFATPDTCRPCHSNYGEAAVEPFRNWQASMMAQSGRDPLTWAAIAVANQDAPSSGETCLRCHLPKGWLEGRSAAADGTLMTADDRQGVQCTICHRLVDPENGPGAPAEDAAILAALDAPVPMPGNAMMVVDPLDRRRGPFDVVADLGTDPHLPAASTLVSPYHQSAALCGTCHNVRNTLFTRNAETGVYELGALGAAGDPALGFPEQATYDEWAASEYAATGVHAPQFGGRLDVVSTCQDCHMPRVRGRDARNAVVRDNLPLHELVGANTFVPRVLPHHPVFGEEVDAEILAFGAERAVDMLRRAATLELALADGTLTVRVQNESGHKLPTGYPDGRRMWLAVRAFDAKRRVVFESGRYLFADAELAGYGAPPGDPDHDPNLHVWEALHGVDDEIAAAVGLPEGKSFHLVLNNVVEKDNRIPPRGFAAAAFDAFGGAPVGASYADGQFWDIVSYPVGANAAAAEVTLWYQTTSRDYVEFLRDENVTNVAGFTLFDLWDEHGRGEPVAMARATVARKPGAAERCRKSVAAAQKRYRKAHFAAWKRCYETETRGLTCDAAARDGALAAAGAALREKLDGAGDRVCRGADVTPVSLGHGTSCPAPCSSITLFDLGDLADCTVCLADELDGDALEAAFGRRPPAVPNTLPGNAARCQAGLSAGASALAAKLPPAYAKCLASGDDPETCAGADRVLAGVERTVARCPDSSAVPGCGADTATPDAACLFDRVAEAALGSARVTRP